jgi:hypothetical protein
VTVLSPDVIKKVQMTRWFDRWRVIAVNDAYKVMPWADAMYACDNHWWLNAPRDFSAFGGEKWTSHEDNDINHAGQIIAKFPDVKAVAGESGSEFSLDPGLIRYGWNSGFQAINLALLKGCRHIVLVGFDHRHVEGKAHFFGEHPEGIHRMSGQSWDPHIRSFGHAAKWLPKDVTIVNATPGSALKCFPMMSLEDACREAVRRRDDSLYRDRTEPHTAAG